MPINIVYWNKEEVSTWTFRCGKWVPCWLLWEPRAGWLIVSDGGNKPKVWG